MFIFCIWLLIINVSWTRCIIKIHALYIQESLPKHSSEHFQGNSVTPTGGEEAVRGRWGALRSAALACSNDQDYAHERRDMGDLNELNELNDLNELNELNELSDVNDMNEIYKI